MKRELLTAHLFDLTETGTRVTFVKNISPLEQSPRKYIVKVSKMHQNIIVKNFNYYCGLDNSYQSSVVVKANINAKISQVTALPNGPCLHVDE